jgi:DNA-binding LacI/PurR family transcriptional regulator
MTTKRAPTLLDVAHASGVSSATVSRHRRGLRQLAPEVGQRIDRAIRELGYSDNLVARSMSTGRSGVVGVVVLDLHNPHFSSLVSGAQRVAQAQGMSLALVDTAESQAPERQLVEALARRVDGLVVSARLTDGAIEWISRLGKPVVYFGRLALPGVHGVGSDGALAAQLLARHLIDGGHRRVAYLGYRASRWSEERERALGQVLAAAGVPMRVHEVLAPNAAAGEAVAAQVLLGAERPDAVVAYNDLIALGFMHEAQRLGVAVPQKVSVAGFDDIDAARHLSPPLTTVALHSQAQGALAMQRLLQLIHGQGVADGVPTTHDVLTPRLMVRESTRRP